MTRELSLLKNSARFGVGTFKREVYPTNLYDFGGLNFEKTNYYIFRLHEFMGLLKWHLKIRLKTRIILDKRVIGCASREIFCA